MGYQAIGIRRSTPNIGAEILGVDLSEPLGNQQFQVVHDALLDRLVIFFRDQALSAEQHKAFGRRFGKLHVHPAAPSVLSDHPEIFVVKADEKSERVAGEDWHSFGCHLNRTQNSGVSMWR
jgi:taurine dioxygenase